MSTQNHNKPKNAGGVPKTTNIHQIMEGLNKNSHKGTFQKLEQAGYLKPNHSQEWYDLFKTLDNIKTQQQNVAPEEFPTTEEYHQFLKFLKNEKEVTQKKLTDAAMKDMLIGIDMGKSPDATLTPLTSPAYDGDDDGETQTKGEQDMVYLLPMAQEFYTLESILLVDKPLPPQMRKSLLEYRDTLYERMTYLLRDYIALACFGEARHAIDQCDYYIPEILVKNHEIKSRTIAGGIAKQFTLASIVNALEELFDQSWSSSFGGQKWKQCVKALRLLDNQKIFIDHVFDLKHNGSSLFNKTDYSLINCGSVGVLRVFLDFRLNADPMDMLRQYVGDMQLSSRGNLTKYINKILGTSTHKKTTDQLASLLKYKELTFGDKVLPMPVVRPDVVGCLCGNAFVPLVDEQHYCQSCLSGCYTHCSDCRKAWDIMQASKAKPVEAKKDEQQEKVATKTDDTNKR